MKKYFFFLLTIWLPSLCYGQKTDSSTSFIADIVKDAGPNFDLKKALNDPNTLNKILKNDIANKEVYALIETLNFEFKTFENTTTNQSGLGFSYQYDKDFNTALRTYKKTQFGGSFSLQANGNVAFNSNINPANFLNNKASIHLFASSGGVKRRLSDADFKKLLELDNILIKLPKSEIDKSEAFKEKFDIMLSNVTNQYYTDFSLVGGLESNQLFTKKQWVLGSELAYDMKLWNTNSNSNIFNVFDYPFALLRMLSGTDKKFTVDGSTFPTILVGIDYVKPLADSIRERYGDSSSYIRVKAEVGFKTKLAKISDQVIYFVSDYRIYKELNPSASLVKAGYDLYNYFVASIQSSSGFFVSYSYGKLPFDAVNDKVYSLGWQYKF